MTSLIAAGGSGRSTSVIPAVPAAWSVTTIAFIWDTSLYQSSPAWRLRFISARGARSGRGGRVAARPHSDRRRAVSSSSLAFHFGLLGGRQAPQHVDPHARGWE